MPINEVFPHPTVKKVIFQIRFPNLFFIESRIGELQMAIMEKFPESALAFHRHVVFAELGPSVKVEELPDVMSPEQGKKVWQFKSPLGYQLNVLTNSLDISSDFHKTYSNQQSPNRFRDIIEYVLVPFLKLTKLPIVNRVGLRYIDECPFAQKSTKSFISHFNSCFPTDRFSIEDATDCQFLTVVQRGQHFLRYIEKLNPQATPPILILDFDGYSTNVAAEQIMKTTDDLHILIGDEYKNTIKEPVYQYMRGE